MPNSKGAPGLGVTIAAVLVLGCAGETEPTSPAPPPPAPVASVVLDRDTATIAPGGTVQLAVSLKDAQGAPLTGRTVTWSSTTAATASVSSTGLVTGLQVGQSRIVASAEGKSDTATVFVPPAPVAIILEQTGARTVTLGPAGGTIQTVAKNGVQYTLVVPPLALMAPVAITMTPLLTVTGLPLSGGFVAGADFAPSGLVFAKPATLTISTSGQAGPNQVLVGLSYEGRGSGLGLTAAEATPNALTFALTHFSGVIAGFGTTQDIEALYLSLPSLPGLGTPAIDLLMLQVNSVPRDGAVELFLMEGWFDFIILPGLGAVTTDAQLVQAMGEYEMWRRFIPDLLDIYLFVPGGENAPSLVSRRNQWDLAFTTKVTLAIARNKQLCAAPGLASGRVAALDNALFWSRVVRSGVGAVPTPQNGLDLASFQVGLCAQAVIQSVVLADPLQEGVAQNLDATFAIRFADGVTVPSDFVVTASAQGADLQFPGATAAGPAGYFTGTVTPTSSGTVTLDLKGCYAGGQFLLFVTNADEICQTTNLFRNVTSPPPPPPPPPPSPPPPPPPPTGSCPDVVIENDAEVLAAATLTCAKNLRISGFNNNITLPVDLSQLTTVEQGSLIEGQVPGVLFGSLTQHSGSGQGNGTTFRNVTLSTIDLSAVRTGGGIGIGNALNLQSIVIGGSIDFQATLGASPISIVNVPSLTSLTIGGGSISGSLTIEATGLTNLDGIPCGFRVGGNVFISGNPNLSNAVAQAKVNCLIVTGTTVVIDNKVP